MIGYVGCYKNNLNNDNLSRFIFDETSNKFIDIKNVFLICNAKYLSYEDALLISVLQEENQAGIALIDLKAGIVVKKCIEETTACFITSDARYIYTANYHSGDIFIYNKDQYLSLVKIIHTGENSGAHQVILWSNLMIVPCLELNCIYIYNKESNFALVNTIQFNNFVGPRHGIILNQYLYVVSELSNQLFKFSIQNDGQCVLISSLNLMGDNELGKSAAIRISNNGRYIYISIRDMNVIKVIDNQSMEVIQTVSSYGDHPRDIMLSKDNNYIFAVNRYSNNLIAYELNRENGKIGELLDEIYVNHGVSIVLE